MNIRNFIRENLEKWPYTISMQEAQFIPESNGYLFPELIKIQDKIEDNCKTHIEEVVCYSIYGCFFRIMKANFNQGRIIIVNRDEVSIESAMNEFLNDVSESDNVNLKNEVLSWN